MVYIPLVKDSNLLYCHARLWDCLKDIMTGVNTFYNPDNWLPHITIAYGDVDLVKLVCLVEKLASRSFNWTFPVDNLALIGQQEGKMREIANQRRKMRPVEYQCRKLEDEITRIKNPPLLELLEKHFSFQHASDHIRQIFENKNKDQKLFTRFDDLKKAMSLISPGVSCEAF